MPMLYLTKRSVEELPFTSDGQIFYRDTELPGFGVRVGKTKKTYFAEGRCRGRNVRAMIGRHDLLVPELARKKARQVLGDMAGGKDPNAAKKPDASGSITLKTALDSLLCTRGLRLSRRTVEDYTRSVRVTLADWSNRPLQQITRDMVLARHRRISELNGAYAANSVMRHLRLIYNFVASDRDDMPPNPVSILTAKRAWNSEKRRRSMVSPHQLPDWWRAVTAQTEDARDILLVALFTGMRRNEVIALKWEYLDLPGGLLHLPKTKNGDPLDLPLAPFLQDLFRARQTLGGQSEWVFPGKGKTGHIAEVKSMVARVASQSGVSFTMHDLRRTFITIAESLDIPAYSLKQLLNHRSGNDVTSGYTVITAERLRAPVERIAQRISELAHA